MSHFIRFCIWPTQIIGQLPLCIKPHGFLHPTWQNPWHSASITSSFFHVFAMISMSSNDWISICIRLSGKPSSSRQHSSKESSCLYAKYVPIVETNPMFFLWINILFSKSCNECCFYSLSHFHSIVSSVEWNVYTPWGNHRVIRSHQELSPSPPCLCSNAKTSRDGIFWSEFDFPSSFDRQEVHITLPCHWCARVPFPSVRFRLYFKMFWY